MRTQANEARKEAPKPTTRAIVYDKVYVSEWKGRERRAMPSWGKAQITTIQVNEISNSPPPHEDVLEIVEDGVASIKTEGA